MPFEGGGKGTTYLTELSLNWLLSKYGLKRPANFNVEIDTATLAVARAGGMLAVVSSEGGTA